MSIVGFSKFRGALKKQQPSIGLGVAPLCLFKGPRGSSASVCWRVGHGLRV